MRKKPYTEIGIKRKKCFRCGKQARYQWQICADGNQWRPICTECDILLNKLVLKFMKFEDWDLMLCKYISKQYNIM